MAALLPGREGAALGLQGLAIIHNHITPTDVKYLCDLLEPILADKSMTVGDKSRGLDREKGMSVEKEKVLLSGKIRSGSGNFYTRNSSGRDLSGRDLSGRDPSAGRDTSSSRSSGGSSRQLSVSPPGGLRYLDLGFNKMVRV